MTKRQILMKIWVFVEKVLGLMFVEKTENYPYMLKFILYDITWYP